MSSVKPCVLQKRTARVLSHPDDTNHINLIKEAKMAKRILDYSAVPLNLSIDVFDNLNELLNKAKALIYVAFSDQFTEADPKIINHYLWQLGDLVDEAIGQLNAILGSRSIEKE